MSDELVISGSMRLTKNNSTVEFPNDPQEVDVASNVVSMGTLNLTTSYEYIPLGDIATLGFAMFKNLGSDTVLIREDLTGNPRFRLQPGETCGPVRLDPTGFATPAASAEASSSILKFMIIGN